MVIKTRIFELCIRKYRNLAELAQAMEVSVSQIYRVRQGQRSINQKFIIGAKKAFPEYKLDELFYFEPEPSVEPLVSVSGRYRHIVKQWNRSNLVTDIAATRSG